MTLKRILLTVIILAAWNSFALSQGVSKIGTTAAPFLQIGVGSRASALGEAYTAVSQDASAMYWNPSAIDFYTNNDVSFNYSDWFAGMKFMQAGGVLHVDGLGSFGLAVTSFSTPEMVVTTVEEPDGLGTRFDAADLSLGVSYARKLTDRFSFGASFKYISRRIWHESATAIAMDFGITYQLPLKGMQLGMSILNFGSKLKLEGADLAVLYDPDPSSSGNNDQILADQHTKEWALPLSFRFGLSYNAFQTEYHNLLVAADYIHPNDNFSSINLGAEYGFMNYFFARIGYKNLLLEDSEQGLTYGAGVKYFPFGVDYSYIKMKNLGYVQQFSVNVAF